ncbi:MAG: hypothetical protein Q9184_003496 [Pyrenodesmia sp. 2 TL-2023]
MDTDAMDMDMDIDLGPVSAPGTGGSNAPVEAQATSISTDHLSGDAIIHKIHIRGVDDLTTDDLKAFAAEHHPVDLPTRIEWIDDTSANIVYDTPAAAMEALKSFSLPALDHGITSMPLLPLRPAKPMSNHPESRLRVRTAISTDVKRPRAHEASRFYMLHPEHDPREKARWQNESDGGHDYRRRRHGDGEHRRRRAHKRKISLNATIYDDEPGSTADGASAVSRRSSMSMRSDDSERKRLSRGSRRGDFYRPESRSDPDALRDRSASPGKSSGSRMTSARRRLRQRTPLRNRDKELFPTRSSAVGGPQPNKELFPNKNVAASLKKELFPAKTSSAHHRRSDAFDAADETADLFATGLAFSEREVAPHNMAKVVKPAFGRLRSSDPEPQYDPHDAPADAGVSIRGASKHQDTGVSIRGAAQKSHVGTIRELFPDKAGNSGKELFAEQLYYQNSKRNRAEDLFY